LKLIDSLGELATLTLPRSGSFTLGVSLPDGIDLQILQTELIEFYGDRLQLVEEDLVVPVTVEPKPKTPRRRSIRK
jgi:hypothetical protein